MATRRAARSNNNTSEIIMNNNDEPPRSGGSGSGSGRYATQEVSPLEIANDDLSSEDTDPQLSIEEQYFAEREQAKQRQWKESEFAAGLVEPTWADELEAQRRKGSCCCDPSQLCPEEVDPGCGCVYLSAVVCSRLGAGRIGNMAILKERYVMVEAEDDDEETNEGREQMDGFVDEEEGGGLSQRSNTSKSNDATNNKNKSNTTTKRLVRKREIQFILGPFWPMLLFITYPLIFGVSALAFYVGIPGKPLYVQILWAFLTFMLIRALFNTGFRDPGMLKRHREAPPPVVKKKEEDRPRRGLGFRWGNEDGNKWRWQDQAQSYRPKNATYCVDCKVIVEEFDHTCPWTGTAIGKKNMGSFQMFVGLVFVMLIMDIFLITSAGM